RGTMASALIHPVFSLWRSDNRHALLGTTTRSKGTTSPRRREDSRMKVGLFITNQQTLDTDMVSALDEQFAMVCLARDRGWDSLFSGQHYLSNNKQLQMVPLLARLAAEAGEMTIGLGILLL